jgi:FixJ family two-component response regulator
MIVMSKYKLDELNIYVIDDDPIFMKIITQFMEKIKSTLTTPIPFKFWFFDNTGEFFETADPSIPGIVILDYRLNNDDDADVSGLEILDEVKTFNPTLKIISYTGESGDIVKHKLLFGGANHFIQKGAKSLKEFEKALIIEIDELIK